MRLNTEEVGSYPKVFVDRFVAMQYSTSVQNYPAEMHFHAVSYAIHHKRCIVDLILFLKIFDKRFEWNSARHGV
jgi:hypothetical protein